ncbi:MAG: DUF1254 domain-containing protein [Hyphomicrobiales bacterium]|nr:DUF1254 domain-containing protein [Hyphomicrobiales bacterium]
MRKTWLKWFHPRLTWIVIGLLLGGIVHIASVLTVPIVATNDPYGVVGQFGEDLQFNAIPRSTAQNEVLPMFDPNMVHAVCRYDLADRPLRIEVSLPAPYWSMSLYTAGGLSFYSINNRAAERISVDLRLFTSLQLTLFNEAPIADAEQLVLVESPDIAGFALLRAYVRDAEDEAAVYAALDETACAGFELPERATSHRDPVEPIPLPKPQ